MSIIIDESNMRFGPYPEQDCFHIEQSQTYRHLQEGVKMAEFLLIDPQNNRICFIEAKSSSPRPDSAQNFDQFIDDVREKLTNALMLYVAMSLQRHPIVELPESFTNLNLSQTDFQFLLVIYGHKEQWLPPLQDALKQALRIVIKTWSLKPTAVNVINEIEAKNRNLIL